jgi:hypothetical protein
MLHRGGKSQGIVLEHGVEQYISLDVDLACKLKRLYGALEILGGLARGVSLKSLRDA